MGEEMQDACHAVMLSSPSMRSGLVLALVLALARFASAEPPPANALAQALLALAPDTSWTIVRRAPLDFDAHHPQGLVKWGDRLFLTSVERGLYPLRGRGFLHELTADGHRVREREIARGAVFHPGGLDFDGTALWTAISEYRPHSRAQVLRIDPATLEARALFGVADHLGTLVHVPDSDTFVATSWGSQEIYTFDANGALLARRPNPSGAIELQDCKYLEGRLMLGAGFKGKVAGLELFRLDTTTLARSIAVDAKSDRGSPMTRNPVAAELSAGRVRLYCIPDDGRSTLYVLEAR